MAARDDDVRVVLDARPLAELLVARRGGPLFPPLLPGFVRIIYSRRILEGVVAAFREMGVSAPREREYLATLEQEGIMMEAGPAEQVYTDAARDEGLRLAVAAGAQGYVTSDPDLVAFERWEGVEIMASVAEIEVEVEEEEGDELVEIYYANTEQELDLAAKALAEAGIEAVGYNRREFLGGGDLFPRPGGYCPGQIVGSVTVRAADAARARDVLASCGLPWDAPPEEEGPKEKTEG
jgi:predicted nuclease with RNAse H fold